MVALFEDKPRREVGIAALEMRNGVITLKQFADTAGYTVTASTIRRLDPVVIILSKLLYSCPLKSTIRHLNASIPKNDAKQSFRQSMGFSSEVSVNVQTIYGSNEDDASERSCLDGSDKQREEEEDLLNIVEIGRKYFDDVNGESILRQSKCDTTRCGKDFIFSKRLALAALAALIRFSEFEKKIVYQFSNLRIVFDVSDESLILDDTVISCLELLNDKRHGRECRSLISLFKCVTDGGGRLLRSNILHPLRNEKQINKRFNSLQQLLTNGSITERLKSILSTFKKTENLLSSFAYRTYRRDHQHYGRIIENALNLKAILLCFSEMYNLLSDLQSDDKSNETLFNELQSSFDSSKFAELLNGLESALDTNIDYARKKKNDGEYNLRLLQAVKSNKNSFLDAARHKYSEIAENIFSYAEDLKIKFPQLRLRVENTKAKGYIFSYMSPMRSKNDCGQSGYVPQEFIWNKAKGNRTICTTHHLHTLNLNLLEIQTEIFMCTFRELEAVHKLIEDHLQLLYDVSDSVAELDVLLSFYSFSKQYAPTVKPELNKGTKLNIRQGRHLLIKNTNNKPFVPIDVYLSPNHNFQILTGPNGAGKTTYLKTVAFITIIAQLGCFVPAERAELKLFNRICTRIGSSDNLCTQDSSFSLEMKETALILSVASEDTLVLIDELGRGTTRHDGVALGWAISEKMIELKATCISSTHFAELTRLESAHPSAVNVYLSCDVCDDQLLPSYIAKRGISQQQKTFGLLCARATGFPLEVLEDASQLCLDIERVHCQFDCTLAGKRQTHKNNITEIVDIYGNGEEEDSDNCTDKGHEEGAQITDASQCEESEEQIRAGMILHTLISKGSHDDETLKRILRTLQLRTLKLQNSIHSKEAE